VLDGSIIVDQRTGLFVARDLATAAAASAAAAGLGLRPLEAALNRVSAEGTLDGAADGLAGWRRGEVLREVLGVAPVLGLAGSTRLRGYAHTQVRSVGGGDCVQGALRVEGRGRRRESCVSVCVCVPGRAISRPSDVRKGWQQPWQV
jgi:hypothetical protein